jgi:integrase
MFSAEELRVVLEHATPEVKAMVLLGANGGLGNMDVALLPISALDLDGGWLDYPRGKTAVNRRIPLWPETCQAIRDVLARRPDPATPEDAELVFLNGNRRGYAAGGYSDRVQRELKKVTEAAAVVGRTFYDLRRTFETIAGETRDQVAVDAVMGHAPKHGDMAAVYRQRVSDDRLRAVVDFVHTWLYPPDTDGDQADTDEPPATVKFPAAS